MNFTPLALDFLLVGLALVVFVADLLLPNGEKRGLGALTAFGLLGLLGASFLLDLEGTAFTGAYATDTFALYLKRTFLVAGFLGVLGSIDHLDRKLPNRQGEYYLLLLSSLLGMSLLAGARELIFLVVAFELMGIPLYVMAALAKRDGRDVEAALKLYLVGATSSAITLYGLSLLYGCAGTTAIADLARAEATPLFRLGMLATLAGMGFKVGMVPFHQWVPDTYEGAPTPFVAFLSVAPKAAGFAAFIRLFAAGLFPLHDTWGHVALVIAGVTMVVGNMLAIPQDNVKRLLAGSGIAHVGILLLAFAVATEKSLGMLLFYLLAYVFTNMGAFLVHEVISEQHGGDGLSVYRGLARRAPALALAMLVFLLSLGGIPFVAGFWAKFYVFLAAYEAGQGFLVFMGASLAVLALFYYLKVGRAMYIVEASEGLPETLAPLSLPMRSALILCAVGVVGLGVFPRPFVDAALQAARELGLGG